MVWMMSLPRGFGEFWPDGDFEDGDNPDAIGWGGRLKAHIKELPVEQQRELMPSGDWISYGYFVSKKFITETGEKAAVDLPPVTPVLEHEAPTSFNTERAIKKIGDLIMLNSRILAVSAELKAIIEDLEPDAHQFFPLQIVQPRAVYPKQFFTVVIGNYRNSFRDLEGTLGRWGEGERYQFSSITKAGASTMHFQRSAFGTAHLWRERLFNEFIVNFSDELVARIEEAGLRTPKLHRAKEID